MDRVGWIVVYDVMFVKFKVYCIYLLLFIIDGGLGVSSLCGVEFVGWFFLGVMMDCCMFQVISCCYRSSCFFVYCWFVYLLVFMVGGF